MKPKRWQILNLKFHLGKMHIKHLRAFFAQTKWKFSQWKTFSSWKFQDETCGRLIDPLLLIWGFRYFACVLHAYHKLVYRMILRNDLNDLFQNYICFMLIASTHQSNLSSGLVEERWKGCRNDGCMPNSVWRCSVSSTIEKRCKYREHIVATMLTSCNLKLLTSWAPRAKDRLDLKF